MKIVKGIFGTNVTLSKKDTRTLEEAREPADQLRAVLADVALSQINEKGARSVNVYASKECGGYLIHSYLPIPPMIDELGRVLPGTSGDIVRCDHRRAEA